MKGRWKSDTGPEGPELEDQQEEIQSNSSCTAVEEEQPRHVFPSGHGSKISISDSGIAFRNAH
jgi:hypothetical protein